MKIYTDGSKQENSATGAAIFVDDISSTFSWRLDSQHSIVTSELYAIYQGILFAVRNFANQDFVIFTDSLSSLEMIKNQKIDNYNRLVNLIIFNIYDILVRGVKVVLQWIPSHKGIIGNNIADEVAKTACKYTSLTPIPFEYKDIVRLLNLKLTKSRITHWNQIKDTLAFSKVIQDVSQWQWISVEKRFYDVLLARFRSGCIQLNGYLHKIKMIDSPYCSNCGNTEESIEHFIFICPRYSNERKEMYNQLLQLNIRNNSVNLQLLLTGGSFSDKKRVRILKLFVKFIMESKRFIE